MKFLKIDSQTFINFDHVETVWFNQNWIDGGFKRLEGRDVPANLCVVYFNRNDIHSYQQGDGGSYSTQAKKEFRGGQEDEARRVYNFINGVCVEVGVV